MTFAKTTESFFLCCPTFFDNGFQIAVQRLICTIKLSPTFAGAYPRSLAKSTA